MSGHQDTSKNETAEQSTDVQQQRRKAVRNILLGGGVVTASQAAPEKWGKPVLDSVVLPAHATTTDASAAAAGANTTAAPDPKLTNVYLMYTCLGESGSYDADFIVDIGGSIDMAKAGVKVRLTLSWAYTSTTTPAPGYTPSDTPPMVIDVVTAADGSFSSPGNNIGNYLNEISVVASLTDYPTAATVNDMIMPGATYSGYCLSAPAPV